MIKKDYIEKMKKEVFDYITSCLECPDPQDYYPYKRKVAASYAFLKREKNEVLSDKKNSDEFELIKFFKDIDKIISLSEENKKLYSIVSRNDLSKEDNVEMISITSKENKKILNKIKRVSKKSEETVKELNNKSKELKLLGAINKLYERRIKILEMTLNLDNKKIK